MTPDLASTVTLLLSAFAGALVTASQGPPP